MLLPMKRHTSLLLLSSVVSLTCALPLSAQSPAPASTVPAADPAAAAPNTQERAAATTPAAAPALPASRLLPTADTSTPIGQTATGSLDAGRVASVIQGQEVAAKDALIEEVTARYEAVDARLAQMRERAGELDEAGRRSVDSATDAYEKQKAKLQEALAEARQAEGKDWERARSTLATEYAFYASAVGTLEVALP